MDFCKNNIDFPYFTITRVFRDKEYVHFAFIGIQNYSSLLKSLKNLNSTKDIKKLKDIFGEHNINLWKKGPVIFINDRIWTDDTIFQIKKKIFTYLSNPDKEFIIPVHQELWIGENNILGLKFKKYSETELDKYINYGPAINKTPFIDKLFVSDDDEKISYIRSIPEDDIILYDLIDKKSQITSQIFMYYIEDEMTWLKNNPIFEENKQVSIKRIWNGYIPQHWPFANEKKYSNETLYDSIKNEIYSNSNKMSLIREKEIKNKIEFDKCSIVTMDIWTRPPATDENTVFRLNMIYNYLRTLISSEIPFIYYTSYGDKIPYISIHKEAINKEITIIK